MRPRRLAFRLAIAAAALWFIGLGADGLPLPGVLLVLSAVAVWSVIDEASDAIPFTISRRLPLLTLHRDRSVERRPAGFLELEALVLRARDSGHAASHRLRPLLADLAGHSESALADRPALRAILDGENPVAFDDLALALDEIEGAGEG